MCALNGFVHSHVKDVRRPQLKKDQFDAWYMHPKTAVVVLLLASTGEGSGLCLCVLALLTTASVHTGTANHQTFRRLYMALGAVWCGSALGRH